MRIITIFQLRLKVSRSIISCLYYIFMLIEIQYSFSSWRNIIRLICSERMKSLLNSTLFLVKASVNLTLRSSMAIERKTKIWGKLQVPIKDYKIDWGRTTIYTFKHHFTNLSNQLSQVIKCSNGIGISDNSLSDLEWNLFYF